MACQVREELQSKVITASERLFAASSNLVEVAGTGQPTRFISILRECRAVRTHIYSLREQIAAHRIQHGCGT
jgi:hypothetical protein